MKMPKEENGFIKTLNDMGYMTSTLDEFSKQYFDTCRDQTFLEIGTAYGVAIMEVLKHGPKKLLANDLDSKHLDILKEKLSKKDLEKLEFLPGDFLKNLKQLGSSTLDRIYTCRVLHFLNGKELGEAIQKFYYWLNPGGTLCILVETPYLRNFQSFIPIFEKRKADGERYPGLIEDFSSFKTERVQDLPERLHFFDKDTLSREFESDKWEVQKCEFIRRDNFPDDIRLDGKESVGIIVKKMK